jgi:hypothetical protein
METWHRAAEGVGLRSSARTGLARIISPLPVLLSRSRRLWRGEPSHYSRNQREAVQGQALGSGRGLKPSERTWEAEDALAPHLARAVRQRELGPAMGESLG